MKKRWSDGERWLGGYVRVRNKLVTFYIERRVSGERYHVCTRAHSEGVAQKHLVRFEADPSSYMPGGDAEGRVRMTGELLDRFNLWQSTGADAVSRKHALYTSKYLSHWMAEIGRRDLRGLRLHELKRMLEQWKGARHLRIAALKVFFAWLREEEGLIRHSEDVTLNLAVPQARPEQRRRKKALEWSAVEKVLPLLVDDVRDCVMVLSATGWHVSELERFAKGGEIAPGDGALATLVVKHKHGELALTRLQHQHHLDAATRLRERGRIPYRLSDKVGDASEAVGARFTCGIFRHSVATWAHNAGADIKAISVFLGHKDPRTTQNFYVDMRRAPPAVPVRVVGDGH